MTNAVIEPEDTVPEAAPAGDCFCSWLDADERRRREQRTEAATESRAEAVRLLRLAEARAAGEPGLLIGIAMAWKDIAHLQY